MAVYVGVPDEVVTRVTSASAPGKVLFASPIQPIGGCSPNVYSWDKQPTGVRVAMSFLHHPGLSFLGENLPCQILPYPTEQDFDDALARRPDILGISFYINETAIALSMAARARAAGVREVWAGNYGAYSPEVASHFDRVITGWGESQIAAALGLPPIDAGALRHPEMYGAIGTNLFPRMLLSGILFTSRGCPWTCEFCQTPDFYGRATKVPLAAIDRALWTYQRHGITGINILDENFGTFASHSADVVDLLHKYKMRWIALTRVDTLLKHFDKWMAKGLFGAHLGIESLNQTALTGANKRINQSDSVRLLQAMSRANMFVQAFYIIGFEQDTVASVRRDISALAALDIDVVQVQVLTPYPQTEQRRMIEATYGLLDADLSRYNSRHLVWRHPAISPGEMRDLQRLANATLSSSRRAVRTLAKFAVYFGRPAANLAGLQALVNTTRGPSRRLQAQYAHGVAGARRWARAGWYPYEEVGPAVEP